MTTTEPPIQPAPKRTGELALRLLTAAVGIPVLVMILTTFATDTGAYATGKLIGRHKLAPQISPGKTVEGAAGGLVAAAVAAAALNALLGLGQQPAGSALLGAAVAVAGQAGDL